MKKMKKMKKTTKTVLIIIAAVLFLNVGVLKYSQYTANHFSPLSQADTYWKSADGNIVFFVQDFLQEVPVNTINAPYGRIMTKNGEENFFLVAVGGGGGDIILLPYEAYRLIHAGPYEQTMRCFDSDKKLGEWIAYYPSKDKCVVTVKKGTLLSPGEKIVFYRIDKSDVDEQFTQPNLVVTEEFTD